MGIERTEVRQHMPVDNGSGLEASNIFRAHVLHSQHFMEIGTENAFFRVFSKIAVGSERYLGIY